MSALPATDIETMSEAEYLAFERASEIKHEYFGGHVYAMSGASEPHNLIAGNTLASLHVQLRGRGCKVYPSDMKVRTPATRSYAYPDITVVCGEAKFDDDQRDILVNPTVIIEILSPSTEKYDRGLKFQHYRELGSLQEYILIAQDSPHIERFLRQDGGLWQFSDVTGTDAKIDLSSIDCTLHLSDVYEQVDFNTDVDEDRPH